MSAANRKRGARAERSVVEFLRRSGWPDARRYLAGDGRQPGDIDWHPLVCLEVKDVAGSSWPSWCRQAAAEARPGMVPVVVRRTRGVPDVGAWPVRAQWRPWLDVLGRPAPAFACWDGTAHYVTDAGTWFESTMAELVAAVKAVDAS